MLSNFFDITSNDVYWQKYTPAYKTPPIISFKLTEDLDASAQNVILSGISFDYEKQGRYACFPVITRKQGEPYYKSIGVCHILESQNFFSDSNLPQNTYLIQ